MNTSAESLPKHLRRYVVEQHYEKYTPVDQAVWRFVLRQLRSFLSQYAHESYLDGLEKTGISVEKIPRISEISEKLSQFGWRAFPVSGFIPPAAFMELQSLSVLPIASDLRTLEHLMYTPAPDIVHEAAGHAPILVNAEFAQYLHEYASVARRAIISKEDLDLYEAIRDLSDLKEHPDTTAEQIELAQSRLNQVSKSISFISEATELSRMNWWTAEYGLIGTLENPRLFGAGLLSSVGESKLCLSDKVRKLPISVDCVKQGYDITEPQPQLFVTPDFKTLSKVLDEFAKTMAFETGGLTGLNKALRARTVNTAQWSSGLQVGGELAEIITDPEGQPAYLKFKGPTQLAWKDKQLPGHGTEYHKQGFSSPVGALKGSSLNLATASAAQFADLGLCEGQRSRLEFASGVVVEGTYQKSLAREGQNLILTFTDTRVTHGNQVYFEPSWGTYDMAVGLSIPSVYGGAPDREAYGETEDFVAKRIPERKFSETEMALHLQYEKIRSLRESELQGPGLVNHLEAYLLTHDKMFAQDWLFRIEALELVRSRAPNPALEKKIREDLNRIKEQKPSTAEVIDDGLRLADRI